MFSLFSSFDNFWMFFPNFSEVFLFLVVFYSNYKFNFLSHILKYLSSFIMNFMNSLGSSTVGKSVLLFFWCIMLLILSLNFSSVFSFNFAYSSQVSSVLVLSLGVWVGLMLFCFVNNWKGFVQHLVPEGSPLPLVPALFVIEIVSSLIRPITLTVRLVANILAGHLLLILLSKLVVSYLPSLFFYFFLNSVEFAVAVIQSYIFLTMITLYYCEVN